jgi:hypothetical protein
MVVSMNNKWHYFLLLPLGISMIGVMRLYQPSHYFDEKTNMRTRDLILTIVLAVVFISVGLDPYSEKTYQVVLRELVVVMIGILSFLICFSSQIRNVYIRILGVMFVSFLFIFSLTFIINDEPKLRKGLYIASIGLMTFFMLYYIGSMSRSAFQQKRIQKPATAFEIRQLPKARAY